MKTNKSFYVGIVLVLLSVMLVAIPTPVGASSNIVYIDFQPKTFASFMVDSVEHLFWAGVVTASPYGTGNMVIVIKIVSVNLYNASVYVASENLLLGQKYAWLVSLVYPACAPGNYIFEGVQSASITIEETATNLTATVSGPISLSITYTPYGDNSTFIEDPGDRPYLYDYDGDGFWSFSTRRACTANGSFNGYQLGPTNLNWGNFDITDYECYDLDIIHSVGVKAGDWAGFGDISFEYASNIPGSEQPPPEMNMSWSDIEVLEVSDSNVTFRSTTIYANGTEVTERGWGDIATGEGNLSVMIIPSNLGAGDEIPANLTWYTGESLKLIINGTITKKYAGANREVNYANISYPIIYDNLTFGSMNMSFYWDKKSGVMCEEILSSSMSYMVDTTHYYMNMSMMFRMTATNMWPAVFTVQDGYTFNVIMSSNSSISDFNFNETLKQISFSVTGPAGKAGYSNVTVPKDLLQGTPWTILLNDTDWTSLCTITENATHTFIYVPYTNSTNTIQIVGTWVIPEFTSSLIVSLFMILSLISVVFMKLNGHRRILSYSRLKVLFQQTTEVSNSQTEIFCQ